MSGKLTIIMIAHRLSTIRTAENLVFLEHPWEQLTAEKGTPEYDSIMNKLQQKNYAHQMDDNEAEQMHKIKLHLKAKAAGQLSSAHHQTSTMNVGN